MAIQGDYEKEADMQEEQKQLGILGNILFDSKSLQIMLMTICIKMIKYME